MTPPPPSGAAPPGIAPFGPTPDGRPVHAVTLRAGELTARILTLGASLDAFGPPDRSVVLGGDMAWRRTRPYHGAVVGPVANRISHGTAPLDGRTLTFPGADPHLLHGGPTGTHAQIWDVADHAPSEVTLTLTLPDGLGGFPGTRRLSARYALTPDALTIDLGAVTDAPTLLSLAPHPYLNLTGAESFAGHRLQVPADRYLPARGDIPTGIADVTGTAFDLRAPRRLVPGAPPRDNTLCVADAPGRLRAVAALWADGAGPSLAVRANQPGLHVYDNVDDGHRGLAIEPQMWPDAPGRAGWPPIELHPGMTLRNLSEWRLSR
ncbi:MAG: aldose epimerase family protein [Paracoccaceae bacterium]